MKKICCLLMVFGMMYGVSLAEPTVVTIEQTVVKRIPKSGWLSSPYRYFFDVYNPYDVAIQVDLLIRPKNPFPGEAQPGVHQQQHWVASRQHKIFYLDCELPPSWRGGDGLYGIKEFEIVFHKAGRASLTRRIPVARSYEDLDR